MNKIVSILLIITCLFSSCSDVNKAKKIDSFYDKQKTHKKLNGFLDHNLETGNWDFYTYDGIKYKSGRFDKGFLIDDWNYNINKKDTIIKWGKRNFKNLTLSLPLGFELYNKQTTGDTNFVFQNTLNKDIFSLTYIETHGKFKITDLLGSDVKLFRESQKIISDSAFRVLREDDYSYYYVSSFFDDELNYVVSSNSIYKMMGTKIIVISYTGNIRYKTLNEIISGDIFEHIYFKNKRLFDPFTEIKDASQVIFN